MPLNQLKIAAIKAEYQVILKVLQETNFNKSKAAEKLGIDRTSIVNKIRKYKQAILQEERQQRESIPGNI